MSGQQRPCQSQNNSAHYFKVSLFLKMRFHTVAQPALELAIQGSWPHSGRLPTSGLPSAGITGVLYHTQFLRSLSSLS